MSSAPTAAPATERKSKLNPSGNLLDVIDLKTYFRTMDGVVKAVDGVDFALKPGQTLGVVGESGCGKSVTSLSIMRLVDQPGWIAGGQICFKGSDLAKVSEKQMRTYPRRRDLDDLPGADDLPQPGLHRGESGHGGDHRAPQDQQARGAGADGRAVPHGRHPLARAPRQGLSAQHVAAVCASA